MKSQVSDIVRRAKRMHIGYLAEDYDGLSQYVKVTLSRASTSVGMKARVAAGDHGGRRRFPAGTRVPVVSIRGQLEVLLGNLPGCGIDHFRRTVAQGGGIGPFGTWLDAAQMSEFEFNEADLDFYSVDGEYLRLGYNSSSFDNTVGQGPMQGLHFQGGLPLPLDISFEHHLIGSGGSFPDYHNVLLYLGPRHYMNHDTWISYAANWDDSPEDVVYSFAYTDDIGYIWPIDDAHPDQVAGARVSASSAEAEMPWRVRIIVDRVGFRCRTWRADLAEPSDFPVRRYWDSGSPPSREMFNFLYFETQASNSPYIGNPQPTLLINWLKICPKPPVMSTQPDYLDAG